MTAAVASSFTLIEWGRRRAQRTFLTILVGTILGKLVLFGLATLLVVRYTALPAVAFILGSPGPGCSRAFRL